MRFFLADLPARTTEQDLRTLFQDYGKVDRVELKTKEQPGDSGQTTTKVIAFVTVQTEDGEYCVNELNWQRLHGSKLRVSVAKESFLDRLKRERDENQKNEQSQANAGDLNQSSSRLLAQNTQNKRRVFGEHEEINDEDVAPELLITKKRAAHSMHNGKIVIQQEHDVKPLHIIEQHKKPSTKTLDGKASKADLKRKESMNKMLQQHQQKKSAIQQALASLEAGQAKRIKFSDAEEEEEKPKEQQVKKDLFDDNDDDADEEEEYMLPEHSGKKGERLVEMQSKQSLDPRFRITANFVGQEEGEEDEQYDEQEEQQQEQQTQDSERNWQMGILEQVIGRKIDTVNAPGTKASNNKKMLRFDPAKEEHKGLVRLKGNKEQPQKKKKQQTEATMDDDGPSKPAPVSQNAFYVVTDTLKQSLKTRGEGFSLLDMFGSSHEEAVAERQDQLEKLGKEKILVNKTNKLGLGTVNPFSYDSSDSEDEPTPDAIEEQQSVSNENAAPAKKQGKQKQKRSQLFIESFFIPKNDIRLKEGAKFFKSSKPELENDNYDNVKKRLKHLITKKIAKTHKSNPGKVVKKNKKKNK